MKISGQKLAAARDAAGVTRYDLAVTADLTHARIWQIETSDFSEVNANIVSAISKKLKIRPEDLQA